MMGITEHWLYLIKVYNILLCGPQNVKTKNLWMYCFVQLTVTQWWRNWKHIHIYCNLRWCCLWTASKIISHTVQISSDNKESQNLKAWGKYIFLKPLRRGNSKWDHPSLDGYGYMGVVEAVDRVNKLLYRATYMMCNMVGLSKLSKFINAFEIESTPNISSWI